MRLSWWQYSYSQKLAGYSLAANQNGGNARVKLVKNMGESPEKWEEVMADVAKLDLAIWHDQTTRRLSGFQLGYIIYI